MDQRLRSLIGCWSARKPSKGTLGYTVDGVYSVTRAENARNTTCASPTGVSRRFSIGGGSAPVPDLPVEVGMDSAGNLVILGGDPERAGCSSGAHEVGPHSHARGSGMEFAIDPRLLTPVKAAPLGGLSVGVAQGAYLYGTALRWWGGGAITLTPPARANQWAWMLVGIDPAAQGLVAVSGSAISVTAPLDPIDAGGDPVRGQSRWRRCA